jgi:hypothetical protein
LILSLSVLAKNQHWYWVITVGFLNRQWYGTRKLSYLSHMMCDEDELYIKVIVLDKTQLCSSNFWFEIVWMSKYTPQDFVESKESICSIVISECVVVVTNLGCRSDQNKSCRYWKLCNFVVYKFLIWIRYDVTLFDS